MPEHHPDLDMLKKHVEQLGEHFDTVQIFTTRCEMGQDDGTVNVAYGSGNWFARYGQIRTWLVKSERDSEIDLEVDRDK